MRKQKFEKFGSLGISVSGGKRIPKGEGFSKEGYPYIRAQDNKGDYIFGETSPKISESLYERLKRYTVKYNDIVLTNVGNSIGDVGIMKNCTEKCILTENCVKITAKKGVLQEFIFAFLKTKYGQSQIKRETVGTAQPKLALERIRDFNISVLSMELQKSVKELVDLSVEKYIEAGLMYSKAEQLFISELGLEAFNPSSEKVSIRTLRESFLSTGRLDGEYYKPVYEDCIKKIERYRGGCELLSDCCEVEDGNYMPDVDRRYNYIELSDIGAGGEISGCTEAFGGELPTRARRRTKEGDVIVSSVEGSLKNCAVITSQYHGALCSTGFYIVRSDRLNPETLLTLFKSDIMAELMKKGCSGTILANISKEEFCRLPIPLIEEKVQAEIADYVRKSISYRERAKIILEKVTESVEIAVDRSEKEAQNLLAEQSRAEQSRAEQSRAEQSRAEQSRAEQSRAEQSRAPLMYCEERAEYFMRLAVFRLYEELELSIERIQPLNCTVKKLGETFGVTGRLDSEYYNKKYDRLLEKLVQSNSEELGRLVEITSSIEPGSDFYEESGIPFVRVQDLTKFEIAGTKVFLNKHLFGDALRPEKDTILLSKDGTVGIAYKVDKDEDFITSSAILHLNIKSDRVLPDYLAAVLNSFIVRMQAERDAGGSIINHWKRAEIEKVRIPIVPLEVQRQVGGLIKESDKLRKRSKALSEAAVKAVEIAIEQGEVKGRELLEDFMCQDSGD